MTKTNLEASLGTAGKANSQPPTVHAATSGPWRVVVRAGRGTNIEWGTADDDEERPICHMRWTDGMRPDVEQRVAADARLIVTAVNHHEAVKALLQRVARHFEYIDAPLGLDAAALLRQIDRGQ